MSDKLVGICFSGGGVKCIAHCGTISKLQAAGIWDQMTHFTGTSGGSMIAALAACKCDPNWLKDKMYGLDFNKFKDDGWIGGDLYRLVGSKGWCMGDVLQNTIGHYLEEITGNSEITISQIYERYGTSLFIPITLIYEQNGDYKYKLEMFSRDNGADVPVKQIVRMSSSIPGFFRSIIYKNCDTTDGGLSCNYPIKFLDVDGVVNKNVIGSRLYSGSEYNSMVSPGPITPTSGIANFIYAIVNAMYEAAQKQHESESDWDRSIKINTGNISAIKFDITKDERMTLFAAGYTATEEFLKEKFEIS
jgi:NTE family protein